jgi:glycosyltransferase involved in cell wall biosynthesis
LRIVQLINVRWWNACADYAIGLSLGLHRRGHRVIVAGHRDSPPLTRAQQLGLPIHITSLGRGGPRGWYADLNDLLSLIRREKIQLLNAHRAEGHLFSGLASLRLGRRLAVIRTRGDIRPPKGHPLNLWLHSRLTDALVLPGEALRDPVLERLGQRLRRIEIIPPGVDANHFRSHLDPSTARRRLGWSSPNEPLVGVVARLSPVKGLDIFLRAAAQVLRSVPGTSFALVGGPAQLKVADLRTMTRRLGIDRRVRLTGWVQDTGPYMEAFDVAVVPSVGSEAICRVALEYMSMSRPVVGTEVNAIPETVVHGQTGLLVPPGDPQALAEAIVILLKDPHRAHSMGQAGRRRVERFYTLEHLARRTEHLYQQVLFGN